MASVVVSSATPFGMRSTILATYQDPKYYYNHDFMPRKPRVVSDGLSLDFSTAEIAKAFLECEKMKPYISFLKLC